MITVLPLLIVLNFKSSAVVSKVGRAQPRGCRKKINHIGLVLI
jgi:hypothetical protein